MSRFLVKAPGRVCLFGEHSDYLGLDVIPAAIDLAITIECSPRNDYEISIDYLDLDERDSFGLGSEIAYRHSRDYLRSAFNILARKGITPQKGWSLEVRGNIPISAGLSSSSALTVAAVHAFSRMAGKFLSPQEIAMLAFEAEVMEFGESGGMMDHFASAYGGIIHIDLGANYKTTRLSARVEGLVIGDSLEKKEDTVSDLRRIRNAIESEYRRIRAAIPDFDQRSTPIDRVVEVTPRSSTEGMRMALTSLENRDLTQRACKVLGNESPDPVELGHLLDHHHELLKIGLKRSTERIEAMISAAKSAGALGCKINGSGGGGTMLALAPGREASVARAIKDAGGIPYNVSVGPGARIEET